MNESVCMNCRDYGSYDECMYCAEKVFVVNTLRCPKLMTTCRWCQEVGEKE